MWYVTCMRTIPKSKCTVHDCSGKELCGGGGWGCKEPEMVAGHQGICTQLLHVHRRVPTVGEKLFTPSKNKLVGTMGEGEINYIVVRFSNHGQGGRVEHVD